MNTIWDDYPANYRQLEIASILAAARAGECSQVIGLSGAGKSNLSGFLAARCSGDPQCVLFDCNLLPGTTLPDFFAEFAQACSFPPTAGRSLPALEAALRQQFAAEPTALCVVIDRFEIVQQQPASPIPANLRALRDRFKYRLTYALTTRTPLDPRSELAELFFANTLWLGPLRPADARWSVEAYARRRGLPWPAATFERILQLSAGYPSFLRAVCEAHAAGAPLEGAALRAHPAVQRRLEEFLAQQPTPEALRRSGLENHPLLQPAPAAPELTAKEALLLAYLQAHPGEVCTKDDLIRAVWSDDQRYEAGLRDDSLAQLARRLRQKIEKNPSAPAHLHTAPGRGYRYTP